MPPGSATPVYHFLDLTLDAGQRRVLRQDRPIEISALNFDLLRILVEAAPNVVTADVLAEKVWNRHFVSPENVTQRVMLLRQCLSDDASQPRYIETVRNKGHRLIPGVQTATSATVPASGKRRRLWVVLAAAAAAAATASAVALGVVWWIPPTDRDEALGRSPPPNSIAVLPFENLSPDPEKAYFADSMDDAIVDRLTKLGSLIVVSSESLRLYAGTQKPIPEIARELNVATVLVGSVLYADGQVRVTPHLIDGATNVNIWTDSYTRELSDIFAVQSGIALNVALAMKAELLPEERAQVMRAPTTSSRAYDLYLLAVARSEGRDVLEEVLKAIDELEQAVWLDPKFVAAWVRLSSVSEVAQFYDPARGAEHRARGEEAANRAIEVDTTDAHAHAALGFAWLNKGNWVGAEAEYREALSLNVPLGDLAQYAVLLSAVGNFAYAREILQEKREATPQNAVGLYFLMLVSAYLGDWTAVAQQYDFGTQLFGPWRGDTVIVHLRVAGGDLDRVRNVTVTDPVNVAMLKNLDAPDAALRELHRLNAAMGPGDPRSRIDIGIWAAHFGDDALALAAMRTSLEEQAARVQYLWLPQFKRARRLPEFKALLRDMGIVAHWEAYGWPPVCRRLGGGDFECD